MKQHVSLTRPPFCYVFKLSIEIRFVLQTNTQLRHITAEWKLLSVTIGSSFPSHGQRNWQTNHDWVPKCSFDINLLCVTVGNSTLINVSTPQTESRQDHFLRPFGNIHSHVFSYLLPCPSHNWDHETDWASLTSELWWKAKDVSRVTVTIKRCQCWRTNPEKTQRGFLPV